MRSIVAVAAAVGALASVPAVAGAAPPPLCVETTQFVLCANDAGQVLGDPGGFVNHVVCYNDVEICSPAE